MATIVKMPRLGETMVEGSVARWLKAPGDSVAKLEPLLEISTDKIDTEVPAPADGVLLQIVAPEGATVRAGAALAYIGAPGEQVDGQDLGADGSSHAQPSPDGVGEPADAVPDRPAGRGFVSPVVGRIAAEHNIDLDQVAGSGLGGRVTKQDLLAYLVQHQPKSSDQKPETGRPIHAPVSNLQTPVSTPQSSDEILEPLSAMRRAIAAHMVQSKAASPHVTTVFEVEMTRVVQHRELHKTALASKGIKLTFTPYFVAAAVAALKAAPRVNSRFTDAGVVLSRRIHIGVAVALDGGLIVPVIRDADEKNLQGLARAVNGLADRARAGALTPDETRGGTFTITNHGVGGSLIGTPIINQPQTGILGIGAIVKRPVVRSTQSGDVRSTRSTDGAASLLPSADDAIVIRPMCYVSFTFDHRTLDGAEADAFLAVVQQTLEQWPSDDP
ncbi:MAG: 2-oxo acid dehydrogenase subunit E2 [Caldilineaceae bacterium]|nr:2-oxo acid dehydrogenase subunit E2 [Caldilineaceae bacterium]